MEGLSLLINQEKAQGSFSGFKVARGLYVTHILFVDDVLIIGDGSMVEWIFLQALLRSFCKPSGLNISARKYFLLYSCSDLGLKDSLLNLFPYN